MSIFRLGIADKDRMDAMRRQWEAVQDPATKDKPTLEPAKEELKEPADTALPPGFTTEPITEPITTEPTTPTQPEPIDSNQLLYDQAQQFADIYSAPQLEALERHLEQAILNAETSAQRIQTMYQTHRDDLTAREQQILELAQYNADKARRDAMMHYQRAAGMLSEREAHAMEQAQLSHDMAVRNMLAQYESMKGTLTEREQQALEQAQLAYDIGTRDVKSSYAGFEDALRRRETEHSRLDLEDAIARGAGRSGVVNHMTGQRQEHYTELLAARLTQKNNELANIRQQLQTTMHSVPRETTQMLENAMRQTQAEIGNLQQQLMQASISIPRQTTQGLQDAMMAKTNQLSDIQHQLGLTQHQVPMQTSQQLQEAYRNMYGDMRGVYDQLDLLQRQHPERVMGVHEQASRIQAQELQRLRDLMYERGRQEKLDTRDDQIAQMQQMFGVFDRTQLTPLEQLQIYANLAGIKGEFPESLPDIFGQYGIK